MQLGMNVLKEKVPKWELWVTSTPLGTVKEGEMKEKSQMPLGDLPTLRFYSFSSTPQHSKRLNNHTDHKPRGRPSIRRVSWTQRRTNLTSVFTPCPSSRCSAVSPRSCAHVLLGCVCSCFHWPPSSSCLYEPIPLGTGETRFHLNKPQAVCFVEEVPSPVYLSVKL